MVKLQLQLWWPHVGKKLFWMQLFWFVIRWSKNNFFLSLTHSQDTIYIFFNIFYSNSSHSVRCTNTYSRYDDYDDDVDATFSRFATLAMKRNAFLYSFSSPYVYMRNIFLFFLFILATNHTQMQFKKYCARRVSVTCMNITPNKFALFSEMPHTNTTGPEKKSPLNK